MNTLTIAPRQNAERRAETVVSVFPVTSASPEDAGLRVPLFIPKNQAYYWTSEWQAGEAEAMADLTSGRVHRFTSGAAAAAWLLADED
jgi:hypothetical protein